MAFVTLLLAVFNGSLSQLRDKHVASIVWRVHSMSCLRIMSSSVTVSRSELRRVERSDSVEFTIGVIADVTTILLVVVAM